MAAMGSLSPKSNCGGSSPTSRNGVLPPSTASGAADGGCGTAGPEPFLGYADVADAISHFVKHSAQAKSTRLGEKMQVVQARVNRLFRRDYNISTIDNRLGDLCSSYPLELVVLESERDPEAEAAGRIPVPVNDAGHLRELFRSSRFSRVHQRFVVPVILVGEKNVCRSATLSVQAEMLFNRTKEFFGSIFSGSGGGGSGGSGDGSGGGGRSKNPEGATPSLEQQREADLALLKALRLQYICDLMVEAKKRKYGLWLTSSEKVEAERYRAFSINSIPYPGCEFFKVYKDNAYVATNLRFDWEQDFVNATLMVDADSAALLQAYNPLSDDEDLGEIDVFSLSADTAAPPPATMSGDPAAAAATEEKADEEEVMRPFLPKRQQSIEDLVVCKWKHYRKWDLVEITANYLQFILMQICDPTQDSGVLVHCISGWDRTPLFLSLLRLTLWADGIIHRSLSADELLYLTVAYDWMLFGHNIGDRLVKGEDVFYFCFDFLKYITDQRYSLHAIRRSREEQEQRRRRHRQHQHRERLRARQQQQVSDPQQPSESPRRGSNAALVVQPGMPRIITSHFETPLAAAVFNQEGPTELQAAADAAATPGAPEAEDVAVLAAEDQLDPDADASVLPDDMELLQRMEEMNRMISSRLCTFDCPPAPATAGAATSAFPEIERSNPHVPVVAEPAAVAARSASLAQSSGLPSAARSSFGFNGLVARLFGNSPASPSSLDPPGLELVAEPLGEGGGEEELSTAFPPAHDGEESHADSQIIHPEASGVDGQADPEAQPSSAVPSAEEELLMPPGRVSSQRSSAIRIPEQNSHRGGWSSRGLILSGEDGGGGDRFRRAPAQDTPPRQFDNRRSSTSSNQPNHFSHSSVGSMLAPPGSWQLVDDSLPRPVGEAAAQPKGSTSLHPQQQQQQQPKPQQQLLLRHQTVSDSDNLETPANPPALAAPRCVVSVQPCTNQAKRLETSAAIGDGNNNSPTNNSTASLPAPCVPSSPALPQPISEGSSVTPVESHPLDDEELAAGSDALDGSEGPSPASRPPTDEERMAAASVLRVERLLTLRQLFMQAYTVAIPSGPASAAVLP